MHRGRLVAVLAVSSTILLAEVLVGLLSNSLALLADAGHVFADVVGTSLALAAIELASRPATGKRTFGFYSRSPLTSSPRPGDVWGVSLRSRLDRC